MDIWQEASLPEDLKKLSREVSVSSESGFLGTLYLREAGHNLLVHKNKYGRDYDEPVSPTPLYNLP